MIETEDSRPVHKIEAPQSIWGKQLGVTIQAINKQGKMSLLSDSVSFKVWNHTQGNIVKEIPANKTLYIDKHVPQITAIAAPIIGLSALEATADEIILIWPEITDAQDYKIYWDKGSNDNLNLLKNLSATTNGQQGFLRRRLGLRPNAEAGRYLQV
jgi:CxxC motif-containing protein (DUF1111 family)